MWLVKMNKKTPFQRYQDYVNQLKESGEKFPSNNSGDINFTIIAKECGNRRQWFSENANKVMGDTQKTLSQIIKNDLVSIGTALKSPKKPESILSDISEKIKKENNRLLKSLEQATAEIEKLRSQVEDLEFKLSNVKRESDERFNEMSESGRSFNHAEP